MIIDSLNKNTIRKYIPNVLAEVKGEASLYDKLMPWLIQSKLWLETEYIGAADFLNEEHNELALRIVVTKAFADAIPSLDLTLTATGFGVISTDSMAPASKERVERLIQSLREHVDQCLAELVDFCHLYEDWRESERGRYFCATFLSSLKDLNGMPQKSYDELHSDALRVEQILAEKYLGHDLMKLLRESYNAREYASRDRDYLISWTRMAIVRLVRVNATDQRMFWNECRPILNRLELDKECYDIWYKEMGALFGREPFKNDIRGAFYY